MKSADSFILPLLAAAVFLGIWHFGVIVSGTHVFPSPRAVVLAFSELYEKGLLGAYVGASLVRVMTGFGAAVLLGIPVGLLMGWYPSFFAAVNPLIQSMRTISPIAWIPVAILFFGISNAAPIFLVFLSAFFPICVATTTGVRTVPEMYRRAGANFGLSPAMLLSRVVFPAALPQILTGLRIALGVAWLVVVAAEMIAVNSGLGYLIIDSRNAGKRYDLVVASMVLIGLIGLGLDVLVRRVEVFRSVRWGFRRNA